MPYVRSRLGYIATFAAVGPLLAIPAFANDGGIAFGGSPRLLKSHPTVSMMREKVTMTVGAQVATVDCRFVFRNSGPACRVRMGFPDRGEGADNPEEEGEVKRIKSTFESFRSWVNGKPAATKLIRADRPGSYWHAKTVEFPANATLVVRDLYRAGIGSQITREGGSVRLAAYVLHTGSSWNGKIGRTEVEVEFKRPGMRGPLRAVRMPAGSHPGDLRSAPRRPAMVVYRGPAAPEVNQTTLRFVRNDWRPTRKDDILLLFDYQRPKAKR